MPFNTLGYKWGSSAVSGTTGGRIEWSVSADLYDSLPKEAGVTNEQLDAALVAAFETWESVASIDFVRVESGGDIQVIADTTPIQVVGYADFQDGNGNGILEAGSEGGVIAFSDNLSGLTQDWTPFGDGGINFFVVALHEIGHAIGLDHYDQSLQVMNTTLTPELTNLRDGDIAGAQFLYGTDPGDVDDVGGGSSGGGGTTPPSGGGDGGTSGGGGLLLGLLGLIALLFGGLGGGAVAALAARYREDTDESDDGLSNAELASMLPVFGVHDHGDACGCDDCLGHNHDHDHGHHHHTHSEDCGCAACVGHTHDHGGTPQTIADLLPMIPVDEHDHGPDGRHLVYWDEGDVEDDKPFLL